MATGARMAMPTETAHVLTLAQWFSPAYPVGAFSYSHGLERAVQAGCVTDGASLGAWIGDVLAHGEGRSDAVFLHAFASNLQRLSATAFRPEIAAMPHETQYSRIFRT